MMQSSRRTGRPCRVLSTLPTKGRKNRSGRRGRSRRESGRHTQINIQTFVEVPQGASGLKFSVEELCRKYFLDPRMVRFDKFIVRLSLTSVNDKFTQYQILTTLDDENNEPTVMTNPRVLNNLSRSSTIVPPSNRRYFVGDKTDFVMLVVHFAAVAATTVFLDITSFVTIERDLINSLNFRHTEPVMTYRSSCNDDWDNARDLDSHSTTSRPVSTIKQAVRRHQ